MFLLETIGVLNYSPDDYDISELTASSDCFNNVAPILQLNTLEFFQWETSLTIEITENRIAQQIR